MPLEWGDHANDCVSAAAAAIVAQGGSDLVGDRRWSNEAEAEAAIDAAGGISAAVSSVLMEIAPAFAQRGDIGAVLAGNRLILVVVEGDTLAAPGDLGLRRLPRKFMVQAWQAL